MRTFSLLVRSPGPTVLAAIRLHHYLTWSDLSESTDAATTVGGPLLAGLSFSLATRLQGAFSRTGMTLELREDGERVVCFRADDPARGDQLFEEISLVGDTLTLKRARLDRLVKKTEAKAARADFEREVARRRSEGLAVVDDTLAFLDAVSPRDPELDARGGSDPSALSVYADWLMERGDPRGELIALQLSGKEEQARAHVARHACHLLGELSVIPAPTMQCEFEQGLLRTVRFLPLPSKVTLLSSPQRLERLVRMGRGLCRLPSSVGLRAVELRMDGDILLDAMMSEGLPGSLRSLTVAPPGTGYVLGASSRPAAREGLELKVDLDFEDGPMRSG